MESDYQSAACVMESSHSRMTATKLDSMAYSLTTLSSPVKSPASIEAMLLLDKYLQQG